jgi:hypothetical protein
MPLMQQQNLAILALLLLLRQYLEPGIPLVASLTLAMTPASVNLGSADRHGT